MNKIFFIILILAFILRFYQLGNVPISLDWDEVSNGYNAYSILKTGRDEYGNFLPLTNRSFDDYKPPIYMYLNVPTIALFDLTAFAVRLPSAILGVFTVAGVFFLAKILFANTQIALISMFFLSISPWHIQFSRIGFEANSGIFFATASFTLLLYGVLSKANERTKNILILFSAVFFGLSFYSYHSIRIFSPLLFLVFLLTFKKEILKAPKSTIIAFLIIVSAIILPFFLLAPKEAILGRYEATSQSTRSDDLEKSVRFISQDQQQNSPFGNLIHNRRIVIGLTTFQNYLSHFDLNYLFTKGDDNLRHHTNNMGMLYFFQLPLLILGVYLFVSGISKPKLFILAWLIVSPVAAAPTSAVPHAVRSYTMVVALQLISAYSLYQILNFSNFKRIIIFAASALVAFALFSYLHNYYGHYKSETAPWWQYGYKEAALESQMLKEKYDYVIVDSSIEQAYAFWLFYTKYDPKTYQVRSHRNNFDKYFFDNLKVGENNSLFITPAGNLPADYKLIKTISGPNGAEIIRIGEK